MSEVARILTSSRGMKVSGAEGFGFASFRVQRVLKVLRDSGLIGL